MKVKMGPYPRRRRNGEWPERKINVKIDKWDTWSMDSTLSLIIHPMLVQLKATKHGAPYTDDADVPEHLRSTSPPIDDANDPKHEGMSPNEVNLFARWDWILDEMIWAFAQHNDENAEDQFYTGEIDFMWIPLDKNHKPLGPARKGDDKTKIRGVRFWQLTTGPNHTHVHDVDGHRAFDNRKKNGFRLFGTYFTHLWD